MFWDEPTTVGVLCELTVDKQEDVTIGIGPDRCGSEPQQDEGNDPWSWNRKRRKFHCGTRGRSLVLGGARTRHASVHVRA